jgi:predicted O-methyltransferase YrrM
VINPSCTPADIYFELDLSTMKSKLQFDAWRFWSKLVAPEMEAFHQITTHLTSREKIKLYSLVRRLARLGQPLAILEIGSYLGASTAFLAGGLGAHQGKVICVDTWKNGGMSEGERDTESEFKSNTSSFGEKVRAIRGCSIDPQVVDAVRSEAGSIDLIFIDGDHSYEGVYGDWCAYSPMLRSGSLVVLHDIGWAEGVQRVLKDDIRLKVGSEGRLPNLWWGSIS